jgi:hypothetical protein
MGPFNLHCLLRRLATARGTVAVVAIGGAGRPVAVAAASVLARVVVGVVVWRQQHDATVQRDRAQLNVEAGARRLSLLLRRRTGLGVSASAFVAARLTLVREGGDAAAQLDDDRDRRLRIAVARKLLRLERKVRGLAAPS